MVYDPAVDLLQEFLYPKVHIFQFKKEIRAWQGCNNGKLDIS